ncbi:MAG TPA: hypothetical protein VGC41_01065 [Kofleriaceae bacterium]
MSEHDRDVKGAEAIETAATPKPDSLLDRFEAIVAYGTPPALGRYLRVLQASPPLFNRAYATLQQLRGNHVAKQAIAHIHANAGGTNATLSGTMLISNNPEAIMTPGKIVEEHVGPGPLAVYAHHSNISGADLDVFMVVKPEGHGEHWSRDGAHAAQHDDHHTPGGNRGQWQNDPNVFVSTVVEAKPGEAAYGMGDHAHGQALDGPKVISLGTIPAVGPKAEPLLLDARYHLDLDGPATVAIVAEPKKHGVAPDRDQRAAKGNMKYQERLGDHMTNGRASGLYTGAMFSEHETVELATTPVRKPLTGSTTDNGALSPQASHRQSRGALTADVIEAVRADLAKAPEIAVVTLLDLHFRIARGWLAQKGASDGTRLHALPAGLADYQVLIDPLLKALRADVHDPHLTRTKAAVDASPPIGADADGASYGTKFDVWYTLHNATNHGLGVELDFVTDTHAPAHPTKQDHAKPWLGTVRVDGVNHAIESDAHNGNYKPSTSLEDVTLHADERKPVHVEFMSPGQATAGQAIDIKPKAK